ncbi:MAG: phosphatidylserine decarboxylase [Candidatus Sumerlaeota bacterium]|nr:phosphatidylserine decarboxylase [Candidatus Sumerlaeota bacterium]
MRIPIAVDGYRFIIPSLALTLIFAWFGSLLWPVCILLGILTVFLIYFFRDFERTTPRIENAIFSGGDGLVDDIEEVEMPDFPGGRAMKVGCFLSLFNCHISRAPVRGKIRAIQYQKGKFHNAMVPASRTENENNRILIESPVGLVMMRQIAGLVARRIVCTARIGQQVESGERVGLIRMGSRIEVYFPVEAELRVKKGDNVKAGLSVLAIIKE